MRAGRGRGIRVMVASPAGKTCKGVQRLVGLFGSLLLGEFPALDELRITCAPNGVREHVVL